jgi:hypothetical protein
VKLDRSYHFYGCRVERKEAESAAVKRYWETIADKLSAAGWSWGWISAIDANGRTIWIVDAHRDNGKRFVVRSDEMLSAFVELERITHELAVSALLGDEGNSLSR